MAQRTVIVTTDDLSGEEIAEADVDNVEFEWGGQRYVIDLGPENSEKFQEAMAPWIGHATRVNRNNVTRMQPRKRRDVQHVTAVETDSSAIRAWAESQGIEVSNRGRVSRRIREQYEAAQGHQSSAAV